MWDRIQLCPAHVLSVHMRHLRHLDLRHNQNKSSKQTTAYVLVHPENMKLTCLLVVGAILLEVREVTSATPDNDLLPSGWGEICSLAPLAASDLNASFVCNVTRQDPVRWKLADLRASLAPMAANGTKVSVEVTCENGANISLPWPMRAPGLAELRVRGCTLLDKYIELGTSAERLTDSLRILDVQDCTWLGDTSSFLTILNQVGNLSSEYECGQQSSLVEIISRNVSDVFSSEPDSLGTTPDPGQMFKDVLQKISDSETKCSFLKLQVLDESGNSPFAKHHFEVMVNNNKYPSLRVMNYSYIGLRSVPQQLLEWSRFFPKLELIDLSGNQIADVTFEFPYPADVNMTLRLHYNNISKISVDIFKNWAGIPKLYVDMRHNPVDCACGISDLLVLLKNATAWPGPALTYYRSYVPDLTCFTPYALKGRTLGSLSPAELSCASEVNPAIPGMHLLPAGWGEICSPKPAFASDLNASFVCHVTAKDRIRWQLADLRFTLAAKDVKVSINVTCESGANISLPWPMRAPGLVELRVNGCTLLDKFADLGTSAEHLPDSMRVLDLRNCVWLADEGSLTSGQLLNLTSDYDCGQDSSWVVYIYRNVSDQFPRDSGSPTSPLNDVTDKSGMGSSGSPGNATQSNTLNPAPADSDFLSAAGQEYKNLLQTIQDVDTECNYAKREILDESINPAFPQHYFEFLVSNTKHPELRIMNYSYIGLLTVPQQLKEWPRFFPKLELIDLSHNRIDDLAFDYPYPASVNMTLRLQYNNISKISLDVFKNWASIPKLYVDIRHNPLDCSCDLGDLLVQLKNDTAWPGPALTYYRSYVPDLKCSTPSVLKGRTLGSLSEDELACPVAPADLRPAMAALVVVALLLFVLLVLAVRYRREVRILVFTRAHVLLPCGLPLANVDEKHAARKTYDAFVAYAHEDSEWVIQELCHKLENSLSRSRGACRLCIHQRDFVVGKTIIDNIIDSIAASRHTIVVVSPSFVKSAWAMEELQQAFRQSLEERRRHLVIVMLKEVQQSDMAPVLKRCCKTFTYLEASDSLFWDRLLYSLHVTEKKTIDLEDNEIIEDDDKTTKMKNEGYQTSDEQPLEDGQLVTTLFSETMRSISVYSCGTAGSPTTSENMQLVLPSSIESRFINPSFSFSNEHYRQVSQ